MTSYNYKDYLKEMDLAQWHAERRCDTEASGTLNPASQTISVCQTADGSIHMSGDGHIYISDDGGNITAVQADDMNYFMPTDTKNDEDQAVHNSGWVVTKSEMDAKVDEYAPIYFEIDSMPESLTEKKEANPNIAFKREKRNDEELEGPTGYIDNFRVRNEGFKTWERKTQHTSWGRWEDYKKSR